MMVRDVPARQFRSAAGAGAILALVLGFATAAGATPLSLASSEPVLMVDGSGDGDATVTIGVSDTSSGFDFGFFNGGFNVILPDFSSLGVYNFGGASVVDFAIRDTATSDVYKLSDGLAAMDFSGDVLAANSENPVVLFDYWQNLTITWSVGNNDIVFNIGGSNDGFAPASLATHAPEPGAALLFGVGFILVGWAVRRDVSA
jgi:hypothetical protein